ncbi:Arc family DNA-binding protein [Acetobacter sp. A11-2]|uniref:Arc family DNA-binding protein n=1 Tax=Acetobacter sp. A11-2 TaxID=3157859 RepID=UPI0032ED2E4B
MDTTHLRLRLPTHLKEWVQKSAEQNKRSQNAEVLFWLEQASNRDTGAVAKLSPSASSTTKE